VPKTRLSSTLPSALVGTATEAVPTSAITRVTRKRLIYKILLGPHQFLFHRLAGERGLLFCNGY
jgi:hypothetical protein